MNVKKSYELRKCDSKYVLFTMNPPSYILKPVLIADEYQKIRDNIWVLKHDNLLSIVMEHDDKLCIFADCSEYAYDNGQLFFLREKWYAISKLGTAFVLGMPIDKYKTIFINKDDTVLNYRTDDGWKQKKCKNIEQLSGYGIDELYLDVLRIETEEGTFFVSIKNQFFAGYDHFVNSVVTKVSYNVEFASETQEKQVKFYKFIVAFKEKMLKAGFSTVNRFYLTAEQKYLYEKSTDDFILCLSASLSGYFETNVIININLSRLYSGITEGIYEVICDELHYKKVCDDVVLFKLSAPIAKKELLVVSGNEKEKICYEQDKIGRRKLVIIKC